MFSWPPPDCISGVRGWFQSAGRSLAPRAVRGGWPPSRARKRQGASRGQPGPRNASVARSPALEHSRRQAGASCCRLAGMPVLSFTVSLASLSPGCCLDCGAECGAGPDFPPFPLTTMAEGLSAATGWFRVCPSRSLASSCPAAGCPGAGNCGRTAVRGPWPGKMAVETTSS